MPTERHAMLLAEMGIQLSALRHAFAGPAPGEHSQAPESMGEVRAVRTIALRVAAVDARACPGLYADLGRTLRGAGFDVLVESGTAASADAVITFGMPELARGTNPAHAGFDAPPLATLRSDAAAKRRLWADLRRFMRDARASR